MLPITPFDKSDRESGRLLRLGEALKDAGYSFVTISTPSHRRVNARPGNELARDLRGIFGWNRAFRALNAPQAIFELMNDAAIVARQEVPEGVVLRSRLRVSTLDGDLYFHSAFPTVEMDSVFFGPDTYRYAQVLRRVVPMLGPLRRALDLGCGAGAGAITLASLLPDAEVWATDINPMALALTTLNAELARRGDIQVAHSDMLQGVTGLFDLIASNPPFMIDSDQRVYCDGGGQLGEGLSLAVVESAISRLSAHGSLILYTCVAIIDGIDEFRERATGMLSDAGFVVRYTEIDPDVFGGELGREAYQNTDRISAVELVATRLALR